MTLLELAVTQFDEATKRFEQRRATSTSATSALNSFVQRFERLFLGPGLPQRPYFRHLLQAPGIFLGYGAHVFPGLVQEADEGRWVEAALQLRLIVETLGSASIALDQFSLP